MTPQGLTHRTGHTPNEVADLHGRKWMAPDDVQHAPNGRVAGHVERFRHFLDTEVAPLEAELATAEVGTPWQPTLDPVGRMHPVVWEARREVQRRSARAGLYNPHLSAAVGGGGFSRVEMQHVEEYVYRESGLGLGLAGLGWAGRKVPPRHSSTSPTPPAGATSSR